MGKYSRRDRLFCYMCEDDIEAQSVSLIPDTKD